MKSRFLKKASAGGLILTPLLDMFTIILIFLIVSFEAEDQEFKLNPDVTLPESTARSVFKPAVNLALTPDELVVEGTGLSIPLEDGKFAQRYHDAQEIGPLVEKLETYYENIHENAATPEEADEKAIILLQADKEVGYKDLYLVLRSASIAGFVKYRLAIMKK